MAKNSSRSIILLAAGQGSRMAPLTSDKPKAMLEIDGRPLLSMILDEVADCANEIVVVTGYCHEQVENYLKSDIRKNIKVACNTEFNRDVNILSVDVGVNSLVSPETGYTIIETDLLIERKGWQAIMTAHSNLNDSFWVTHGRYSKNLTGGIVYSCDGSQITSIAYVPEYDPKYDGWHKMLGILSVGPSQVEMDRRLRNRALESGFNQYYMMPWVNNIESLPCVVHDISAYFAASFNTPDAFDHASLAYSEIKSVN